MLSGNFTVSHDHSDVLETAFTLSAYLGHCKMMLNSIDAQCTATISISNLWAMETCLSSSSMISV